MKIANLFRTKKVLFLVLFSFLAIELAYSFLYATHDTGKGWLTLPDLISHQQSPLNASEESLIIKANRILTRYQINADGGLYILLANNFPDYYLESRPLILERPLYSLLIAGVAFLPRLLFDSHTTVFASAIFVNFILAFLSVIFFYYLCEKLINSRVAFLSALLLVFSPFFHLWLVQPVPEILTIFIIIATLFFLDNYIKNPSYLKLIILSLVIGVFMLGKMLFALSIFIVILAFYFKRYKEGALFSIIHLIPLGLWYLIVTKGFGMHYHVNMVSEYGTGIWLLDAFRLPWYNVAQIFLNAIPQFLFMVIYGFLLVPVIFAIVGFNKLAVRHRNFLCLSFIFSFLILIFVINIDSPRYGFWIYPIIYPLTVLGIDRCADFLRRYKKWYSGAFYLAALLSLIVVSNVDICSLFSYR
ncbi:MAG: glycosyltransferase family 39 protein [Candidatus Portnoybacteria bacterium]